MFLRLVMPEDSKCTIASELLSNHIKTQRWFAILSAWKIIELFRFRASMCTEKDFSESARPLVLSNV